MICGGSGGTFLCGLFLPQEPLTHAPASGDWLLVGVAGAFAVTMLSGLVLGIVAVATGSLRRSPQAPPP